MQFKELLRLLHSNFPAERRNGILKVGSFVKQLSLRKGLTIKICKKLSEALFYSMWMQDKPLKQEKLASQIGFHLQKINDFEQLMALLKEFFKTLIEKWYNIDKIRIEKFMMLARIILRVGIVALSKAKWDPTLMKQYHVVLCETVWSKDKTDMALFYHLVDIYIPEVQKKSKELFTSTLVGQMIEPFYQMLSTFKEVSRLRHIAKHIFVEDYDEIPRDYDAIKDKLIQIEDDPKVKKSNKKVVNDIVTKYTDIQNGLDNVLESDNNSYLDEDDIENAVEKLYEEAQKNKLETIKFRKERRNFKPCHIENVENLNLLDFNENDFDEDK